MLEKRGRVSGIFFFRGERERTMIVVVVVMPHVFISKLRVASRLRLLSRCFSRNHKGMLNRGQKGSKSLTLCVIVHIDAIFPIHIYPAVHFGHWSTANNMHV